MPCEGGEGGYDVLFMRISQPPTNSPFTSEPASLSSTSLMMTLPVPPVPPPPDVASVKVASLESVREALEASVTRTRAVVVARYRTPVSPGDARL